jgi:DNA-binding GntR family transcriptional regulator
MTPQTSISRSVLSDQVKDHLLQAILDGRYPPGARIVETRVARELGTSQTPVREALRDLEALGVVETAAFRGARVRRPSVPALLERLTDADLEALQGYVDEMRRSADNGDAHAEATADAAFHGRIVELSGNSTLARVWRTLEPFSRTYITIEAPGADRRKIADQHAPVLDALRRRDPNLVTAVLHEHFDVAARMLARHWGEGDDATPSDAAQPATEPADVEASLSPLA